MKYLREKKEITLDRELSELDKFVISFCGLLDEYVLVSGYVSILFGRSRATEDIDLLIPETSLESFKKNWEKIYSNGFECLNTSNPEEAFKLLKSQNIRFSKLEKPIPNMEYKLIQNDIHKYSFENKIKVKLKNNILYISPLEMQISYKLLLGQQGNIKDLEDAKHIYELFKEEIDIEELNKLNEMLDVEKEFNIIK